MKRFTLSSLTVIAVLILAGCANAVEEPSRIFYRSFSIGEIVENHQDVLLDGPRSFGSSESGPPGPFVQRYEEINLQIDEAGRAAFINLVKNDVGSAITNSGARIEGLGQGGGAGSAYFSFDYRYDQVYGSIHVWAVDGPETSMNIIVLLMEDTPGWR